MSSVAVATTYYCNLATGNDSWDGKSETYTSGKNGPFKTFNYAQGKLRNGDVLYVAPGVYGPAFNGFHGTDKCAFTIIGTGRKENPVVLDGGNTNRCYHFYNANKYGVVIKGLTFRNGYSVEQGGGLRLDNSSAVSIEDCVFENCKSDYATDAGGAIWMRGDTDLLNCTFTNCQANGYGGAVYHGNVSSKRPILYSNCVFTACYVTNSSASGGAFNAGYSEGELTTNAHNLINCTFTDCRSNYRGGAMWALVQKAEGCTFKNCQAREAGGVYYLDAYAGKGGRAGNYDMTNTFISCTFEGNRSEGGSGCFSCAYTKRFNFSNCVFKANSTAGDNAVFGPFAGHVYRVEDCQFIDNVATNSGKGGIFNYTACGTLYRNCTFKGNRPGNKSILIGRTGSVVDRCTFEENEGSIYNSVSDNNEMRNCLVKNNVATGAVSSVIYYEWQWGKGLHIDNCTFVGNVANGYVATPNNTLSNSGQARFANCVFYGNTCKGTTQGYDLGGSFAAIATNCWFETGHTAYPAKHIVGTDPKFRNYAKGNFMPARNSPLRDAGVAYEWLTADSRDLYGKPRVNGARPDIGAAEYWPTKRGIAIFLR